MPSRMPILHYARLTDVGRKRLANEDATHFDERMGLFVVCDGLGGQPSGEAASQIIAHTLRHVIRRHLRQLSKLDPSMLKQILIQAVQEINHHLVPLSEASEALKGMAATLVAALMDNRQAYILNTGDSRAYLFRDGQLKCLTTDHVEGVKQYKAKGDESGEMVELGERRYLVEYIGRKGNVNPDCTILPLKPGDRLLLCTDGLTDPVDEATITKALAANPQPAHACKSLVDLANHHGGPDNITMFVINYEGDRDITPADLKQGTTPKPPDPPRGAAANAYMALKALEVDLAWLLEGAESCSHKDKAKAYEAVKQRLGGGNFEKFMRRNPDQNPSHVYHQFLTAPGSAWRNQYEMHLSQLEPHLKDLCSETLRMSPVLTREETSKILRSLWHDWRRVEHLYFVRCQRAATSESDHSLDYLITHMLNSARTLIGLIEFFPRFMRSAPSASGSHIAMPSPRG